MKIIPSNKVIDMTNYPKDEDSCFKDEFTSISFFEEIFDLQRFIKLINENFGGANFKMLLFGTWCTNLTQLHNYKVG